MKIFLISLTVASVAGTACPAGYSYYNQTQKCYKVYTDASPYFAASDVCRDDGGSLVSIHNAFENTYLANLVPNKNLDHWIGLTNMISGYDFEWLDNSPVQYTNWLPGQPNYDASCVLMEAGNAHWTSQTCRYFLPFICEYDPATAHNPAQTPTTCPPSPTCPACPTLHPTTCPPTPKCPACSTCPTPTEKICPTVHPLTCPPPPKCPTCATCPPQKTCPTAKPCPTPAPKPVCDAGWTYFKHTDSCYFMGNNENLNNSMAQTRCREKDSYLASIHSDAENSFVMNFTYSAAIQPAAIWIGLYRIGPSPNSTDFQNYDGTPVDYTLWAPNQPDNYLGNEFCTLMNVKISGWPDGKWDDFWCTNHLLHYVCKKPSNKN